MPVPTVITDLSSTASSNSPAGTDSVGTSMDDYLRSHASIIKKLYDDLLASALNIGANETVTLGDSATAANNIVLRVPATPNGTLVIEKGDGTDVITTDANGKPDFPQLARSLATNGYYTLPGGLIVQWGVTGTVASGGTSGTNLPIAFPTAAYSGAMTYVNPGLGASVGVPFTSAFTTTEAQVTNNGSGNAQYLFIVIGK